MVMVKVPAPGPAARELDRRDRDSVTTGSSDRHQHQPHGAHRGATATRCLPALFADCARFPDAAVERDYVAFAHRALWPRAGVVVGGFFVVALRTVRDGVSWAEPPAALAACAALVVAASLVVVLTLPPVLRALRSKAAIRSCLGPAIAATERNEARLFEFASVALMVAAFTADRITPVRTAKPVALPLTHENVVLHVYASYFAMPCIVAPSPVRFVISGPLILLVVAAIVGVRVALEHAMIDAVDALLLARWVLEGALTIGALAVWDGARRREFRHLRQCADVINARLTVASALGSLARSAASDPAASPPAMSALDPSSTPAASRFGMPSALVEPPHDVVANMEGIVVLVPCSGADLPDSATASAAHSAEDPSLFDAAGGSSVYADSGSPPQTSAAASALRRTAKATAQRRLAEAVAVAEAVKVVASEAPGCPRPVVVKRLRRGVAVVFARSAFPDPVRNAAASRSHVAAVLFARAVTRSAARILEATAAAAADGSPLDPLGAVVCSGPVEVAPATADEGAEFTAVGGPAFERAIAIASLGVPPLATLVDEPTRFAVSDAFAVARISGAVAFFGSSQGPRSSSGVSAASGISAASHASQFSSGSSPGASGRFRRLPEGPVATFAVGQPWAADLAAVEGRVRGALEAVLRDALADDDDGAALPGDAAAVRIAEFDSGDDDDGGNHANPLRGPSHASTSDVLADAAALAPRFSFRVPWGPLFDDAEIEEEYRRVERSGRGRWIAAVFVLTYACLGPLAAVLDPAADTASPTALASWAAAVVAAIVGVLLCLVNPPGQLWPALQSLAVTNAVIVGLRFAYVGFRPAEPAVAYCVGSYQAAVMTAALYLWCPTSVPWLLIIAPLTALSLAQLPADATGAGLSLKYANIALAFTPIVIAIYGLKLRERAQFAALVAARGSLEACARQNAALLRRLGQLTTPATAAALCDAALAGQLEAALGPRVSPAVVLRVRPAGGAAASASWLRRAARAAASCPELRVHEPHVACDARCVEVTFCLPSKHRDGSVPASVATAVAALRETFFASRANPQASAGASRSLDNTLASVVPPDAMSQRTAVTVSHAVAGTALVPSRASGGHVFAAVNATVAA